MANYEEQTRRQMERAAKEQQTAPPPCPEDGDIDAAFGIKPYKPMRLKRAHKRLSRRRKPL